MGRPRILLEMSFRVEKRIHLHGVEGSEGEKIQLFADKVPLQVQPFQKVSYTGKPIGHF